MYEVGVEGVYVCFVDLCVGWVGYCWVECVVGFGYVVVYGMVEVFEVVVVDVGFVVWGDVG